MIRPFRSIFQYVAIVIMIHDIAQMTMSEYPFSDKQKNRLQELAERYGYQVMTIRLTADFEVLWQRRYKRDREPRRCHNTSKSAVRRIVIT